MDYPAAANTPRRRAFYDRLQAIQAERREMMSKASEYAAALKAARAKEPTFFKNNVDRGVAYAVVEAAVNRTGGLDLKYESTTGGLHPADALGLARWILDTFGDGEA